MWKSNNQLLEEEELISKLRNLYSKQISQVTYSMQLHYLYGFIEQSKILQDKFYEDRLKEEQRVREEKLESISKKCNLSKDELIFLIEELKNN